MQLGRRLKYPYDLVHALMDFLPARCCVCMKPATRRIVMRLIIGEPPHFCDDHNADDNPTTLAWVPYEYTDLGNQTQLVRACNEYLNNTEQKT